MSQRDISDAVREDLKEKFIFLAGPRQVGKTTFAKNLYEKHEYFNYDIPSDRILIEERSWKRDTDLVILDELHKLKNWKLFLKGIFDKERTTPPVLVTGSARLEFARKVGDSMAGRFFHYRLHPFDLKELANQGKPDEIMSALLTLGGFPEPFTKGRESFYRKWRRSHLDVILRQDLIDLESLRDVTSIETMLELLRHRIGSPISYASIARDLQKSPATIKHWFEILENLYVVFRVSPYNKNVARSILKEPKFYFFDLAITEGEGARLENLVACSLQKELHRIEDFLGLKTGLHYLRTKEGKELDFLITIEDKPILIIEVKAADDTPSPHFSAFNKFFPDIPKLQLVKTLAREKDYDWGLKIRKISNWLTNMDLKEFNK
ncbi:MAG: ATP-binding protein [Leptospiraceae bacterium]|nr:ATP-binding protein [Leptospiraceae bacterium]